MDWFTGLLVVACVSLILCPPKWDPAIRWKEFNERWAEALRKRQ